MLRKVPRVPAKCVFGVASGNLLGHVVSQEGIAVDPDKVKAILEAPAPNNAPRRFSDTIARSRTPDTFPMGRNGGEGLPSAEGHVVASSGGAAAGLE